MQKQTVSIYGYGRFGKFWAGLLAKDYHVKVYSRRGLMREEVPDNIEITTYEDLFQCDAMFFCVAISSFEEVLKQSKPLLQSETLYFDTCSVKVFPVKWMLKHLPEGAKIIATHPMFGPDSYFESEEPLSMVMSNINAEESVFKNWVEYFNKQKMHVELMSPDEHDRKVAYSQGITHYVGRVLADLELSRSNIDTLGYQKLFEITEQTCNDSWQLFMDLQQNNPYTAQMRKDLHFSIEKIYKMLK